VEVSLSAIVDAYLPNSRAHERAGHAAGLDLDGRDRIPPDRATLVSFKGVASCPASRISSLDESLLRSRSAICSWRVARMQDVQGRGGGVRGPYPPGGGAACRAARAEDPYRCSEPDPRSGSGGRVARRRHSACSGGSAGRRRHGSTSRRCARAWRERSRHHAPAVARFGAHELPRPGRRCSQSPRISSCASSRCSSSTSRGSSTGAVLQLRRPDRARLRPGRGRARCREPRRLERHARSNPTGERVATSRRSARSRGVLAATEPVEPGLLAQLVELPVVRVEHCATSGAGVTRNRSAVVLVRVAGLPLYQTHPDSRPT